MIMTAPTPDPGSKPSPAAKRLAQIHALQDELTSSPWSHDVIELVMATAVSDPISRRDETAMVWLLVVGNPSGDKTTTARNLSGPKVLYADNLTANALVSGYVPEKGQKKKPDVLTQMQESGAVCLVIKDLTTLFSRGEDKVKAVLGELQSIYDGEYTKWTGTVGGLQHKPHFAIVACITPAALGKHHRYMSEIGSRFLAYAVHALTDEEQEAGMARFWAGTEASRKVLLTRLRALVEGHINGLLATPPGPVEVTVDQRGAINRLAKLLARGRGVIQWKKTDLDTYEIDLVQIEEPFRGIQQLRNLVVSLARVHDRSVVTDHELELVRRVVLSSMPADRAQVLGLFPTHPGGLTVGVCAKAVGKSEGRARQLLDELEQLGLVAKEKGPSGGGAPPNLYRPVPEFADLIIKPVEALDHRGDLGDFAHETPPTRTAKKRDVDGRVRGRGEFYEESGWGLADLVDMPWPVKVRRRTRGVGST